MRRLLNPLKDLLAIVSKRLNINTLDIAKAGFWLNLAQGINMVTAFGLNILFARLLSITVIGEYKYLLSINGLFQAITLSGLATVVTQAISKNQFGAYHIAVKKALRWGIISCVIGFIACVIITVSKQDLRLGIIILFLACITPINDALALYANVLIGLKKYSELSLQQAAVSILQFIALAITAIFFPNSLALLITIVGINITCNLLWSLRVWKRYIKNTIFVESDLTFANHLSFMNMFSSAASQSDRIIIFHGLGAPAVALYAFAIAVPKQIRVIFGFMGSFALPKYAVKDPRQLLHSVRKHFLLSQIVLVPLVVGYLITAPFIYQILFPGYQEAAQLSRIYVLIALLYGNFTQTALQTLKSTAALYRLHIINSVALLTLAPLGLWWNGLAGALIGLVVTKYLSAILSYIFLEIEVRRVQNTS